MARFRWPLRVGIPVMALAVIPGLAAADPTAPSIDLSLRQVPLRVALARLYAGSGVRLEYPEQLPNPPVTAALYGVSRDTALRVLLRQAGGLAARQGPGAVVIIAAPPPAVITVPLTLVTGARAGTSVGPGGVEVPNQRVSGIQATPRLENGRPTEVGGTRVGRGERSSTGPPLLPVTSSRQSGQSTSSSTFVTVTILPDPLEAVRRRRR
jgi:hypothetical protein